MGNHHIHPILTGFTLQDGKTLGGEVLELIHDQMELFALIFWDGFSPQRRHQDLIDEWVPFVEQLVQENPEIHYYEIPTLPPKGIIYRTFLNEGMRAGIPDPATQVRTITLYLDKSAFRKALDIDNEQNVWVYLFDKSGNVLWRTEGKFTKDKSEALLSALNQISLL